MSENTLLRLVLQGNISLKGKDDENVVAQRLKRGFVEAFYPHH